MPLEQWAAPQHIIKTETSIKSQFTKRNYSLTGKLHVAIVSDTWQAQIKQLNSANLLSYFVFFYFTSSIRLQNEEIK